MKDISKSPGIPFTQNPRPVVLFDEWKFKARTLNLRYKCVSYAKPCLCIQNFPNSETLRLFLQFKIVFNTSHGTKRYSKYVPYTVPYRMYSQRICTFLVTKCRNNVVAGISILRIALRGFRLDQVLRSFYITLCTFRFFPVPHFQVAVVQAT